MRTLVTARRTTPVPKMHCRNTQTAITKPYNCKRILSNDIFAQRTHKEYIILNDNHVVQSHKSGARCGKHMKYNAEALWVGDKITIKRSSILPSVATVRGTTGMMNACHTYPTVSTRKKQIPVTLLKDCTHRTKLYCEMAMLSLRKIRQPSVKSFPMIVH